MAHYSPVRLRSHSTAGRTIGGKRVGPACRGRRGKGGGEWTRDASTCRYGPLPLVPPALLPILTDKAAACGGRNVPSGRCAARPKARPLRIDFCIMLTFSRLTGQMRRCLWRRGRRSCPPKPVDTRCLFLVMPGGGLSGVVTERRMEEGRDAVARHGLT